MAKFLCVYLLICLHNGLIISMKPGTCSTTTSTTGKVDVKCYTHPDGDLEDLLEDENIKLDIESLTIYNLTGSIIAWSFSKLKITNLIIPAEGKLILNKDSFNGTSALKSLTINFAELTKIQNIFFYGLDELELLDLEHNKINDIPPGTFRNLKQLKYLILSDNLLDSINKLQFMGLSNLIKLDLSKNNINRIKAESFSSLPQLKYLMLNNNKIRKMVNGTFNSNVTLEYFTISDNPIHCDCSMDWFALWLTKNIVPKTDKVICSAPSNYENTLISDLDFENCVDITSTTTATSELILTTKTKNIPVILHDSPESKIITKNIIESTAFKEMTMGLTTLETTSSTKMETETTLKDINFKSSTLEEAYPTITTTSVILHDSSESKIITKNIIESTDFKETTVELLALETTISKKMETETITKDINFKSTTLKEAHPTITNIQMSTLKYETDQANETTTLQYEIIKMTNKSFLQNSQKEGYTQLNYTAETDNSWIKLTWEVQDRKEHEWLVCFTVINLGKKWTCSHTYNTSIMIAGLEKNISYLICLKNVNENCESCGCFEEKTAKDNQNPQYKHITHHSIPEGQYKSVIGTTSMSISWIPKIDVNSTMLKICFYKKESQNSYTKNDCLEFPSGTNTVEVKHLSPNKKYLICIGYDTDCEIYDKSASNCYCTEEETQNDDSFITAIAIAVGIALLLIIILMTVGFICCIKKTSKKSNNYNIKKAENRYSINTKV